MRWWKINALKLETDFCVLTKMLGGQPNAETIGTLLRNTDLFHDRLLNLADRGQSTRRVDCLDCLSLLHGEHTQRHRCTMGEGGRGGEGEGERGRGERGRGERGEGEGGEGERERGRGGEGERGRGEREGGGGGGGGERVRGEYGNSSYVDIHTQRVIHPSLQALCTCTVGNVYTVHVQRTDQTCQHVYNFVPCS